MNGENSYRKIPIIFGAGAALEQVVLYNSAAHFKNEKLNHKPSSLISENEEKFKTGLWWWNPSEESLPFECCHYSSIHGLPFITRPKLHLSERCFSLEMFQVHVINFMILLFQFIKDFLDNCVYLGCGGCGIPH